MSSWHHITILSSYVVLSKMSAHWMVYSISLLLRNCYYRTFNLKECWNHLSRSDWNSPWAVLPSRCTSEESRVFCHCCSTKIILPPRSTWEFYTPNSRPFWSWFSSCISVSIWLLLCQVLWSLWKIMDWYFPKDQDRETKKRPDISWRWCIDIPKEICPDVVFHYTLHLRMIVCRVCFSLILIVWRVWQTLSLWFSFLHYGKHQQGFVVRIPRGSLFFLRVPPGSWRKNPEASRFCEQLKRRMCLSVAAEQIRKDQLKIRSYFFILARCKAGLTLVQYTLAIHICVC